jgi:hypothetical protein
LSHGAAARSEPAPRRWQCLQPRKLSDFDSSWNRRFLLTRPRLAIDMASHEPVGFALSLCPCFTGPPYGTRISLWNRIDGRPLGARRLHCPYSDALDTAGRESAVLPNQSHGPLHAGTHGTPVAFLPCRPVVCRRDHPALPCLDRIVLAEAEPDRQALLILACLRKGGLGNEAEPAGVDGLG